MEPMTMGDLRRWIEEHAETPDEARICAAMDYPPRDWARHNHYTNDLLGIAATDFD